MPSPPAPIVVPPSGKFLGDDGSWSTFTVNLGNPPQQLELLASTEQPSSWAVEADACTSSDSSSCPSTRGGVFDPSKSTTWFRKDVYQLNEATNLGFGGNQNNGTYGFDTLGFGGAGASPNISIDHSVIASIVTDSFYLGSLGLSPEVINFTSPGDSSPSLISALKTKGMVPSLSWGYTAGAYYKDGGVNTSLTLGGYDSSRYTSDLVSFPFTPTEMRNFVVGLQSITYADSKSTKALLSQGILALVDSTVPYLWLPQSSCQIFEDVFGIVWDPVKNLYTVNDTTHDNLVKANPSITFSLANTQSDGPSVNITFPYAAFDLNATIPLVKNETRYFPLQRAADDNSYTLGRVFFQEAYMITNYENSTFSIAQTAFDSNTPSNIVPILSSNGTGSSNSTITQGKKSGSGGIGTGAIAGLAIAIALVGIIVAVTAFICMRRRRRARREAAHAGGETDGVTAGEESKEGSSKVRESSEVGDREDGSDPSKKPGPTTVNVTEVSPTSPFLSEIDGQELYAPGSSRQPPSELPGGLPNHSELSTPEPTPRHELPSPGMEAIGKLRSELSTPEPIWPDSELPTPDPSHELPSNAPPNDASASLLLSHHRHASKNGLAINAPPPPSSTGQPNRPRPSRMDSADSADSGGFTHDGMRQFSPRFTLHQQQQRERRINSTESQGSNAGLSVPSPPFSPLSASSNDADSVASHEAEKTKKPARTGSDVSELEGPAAAIAQGESTATEVVESPVLGKTHYFSSLNAGAEPDKPKEVEKEKDEKPKEEHRHSKAAEKGVADLAANLDGEEQKSKGKEVEE